MSDSHDSPEFIQYLTRLFYIVGGVLVVGTLVTVLIDVTLPLPLGWAALIGLVIALVKAGFVVAIFMHYKWDKKLIWITWTMLLTFFFFAGMIIFFFIPINFIFYSFYTSWSVIFICLNNLASQRRTAYDIPSMFCN